MVNAGRLATQSNAIFSATGTIYNGGAVRVGGNVTFTARRIDNTCDSLLVAGSDAQGQLTQPGNLIMTSQGPLIAQGTHQTSGAVMMWGTEVGIWPAAVSPEMTLCYQLARALSVATTPKSMAAKSPHAPQRH